MAGLISLFHDQVIAQRRVKILSRRIASMIPGPGRLLDVGAGDGRLAAALAEQRPDLSITGVDVLIRPQTAIPVTAYDGKILPFGDATIDFVTLVDVLHHTENPFALLAEATRIARRGIIIKDHVREGFFANTRLKLMDWAGNKDHGVAMTYRYFTLAQWEDVFERTGLRVKARMDRLGLYPEPLNWAFDARLHLIAYLEPIPRQAP